MPVQWVLVATILTLGPYPVALKSYPEYVQCIQAINVLQQQSVRGACVRVLLPRGVTANE